MRCSTRQATVTAFTYIHVTRHTAKVVHDSVSALNIFYCPVPAVTQYKPVHTHSTQELHYSGWLHS